MSNLSENQIQKSPEKGKKTKNTGKFEKENVASEKTDTSSNIKVKHEISKPDIPPVLIKKQKAKSIVDKNLNQKSHLHLKNNPHL